MKAQRKLEPVKDASHLYEVERRDRHAERPGFRISELQLSPALVTRCGRPAAATKLSPTPSLTSCLGFCRNSRILPSRT